MHAFALGHHSHDKRQVGQNAPRFVMFVCFCSAFFGDMFKAGSNSTRISSLVDVLAHIINAS